MCLADEKRLFRSVSGTGLRYLVCPREGAADRFGLVLDNVDKRAGCAGRAARTKLLLPYGSDTRSN